MAKEELVILDQIPFSLDMEKYLTALGVGKRKRFAEKAKKIAEEALKIARPKVLFRPVYIEKREKDTIIIDGIAFKSELLSKNLEDVFRVFPFVATCGEELADWAYAKDNIMEQFCNDILMGEALKAANDTLTAYLKENYGLEKLGQMNPGSLEDWPLSEQKPLFQLLGRVEEVIGVRLTEGLAMYPVKSVSGIFFPSDTEFKNCQLCKRANCPGRRAPFEGKAGI